jgi:hypothetical protein
MQIEYILVRIDDENRVATLSLRGDEILEHYIEEEKKDPQ